MARIWASRTSNKTDLTDDQMGEGFLYESEVKSDFFNGAVFRVQKEQEGIIWATPQSRKGQIVRVLTVQKKDTYRERYHWDYYICIRDGTTASPISGAFLNKEKGYWQNFDTTQKRISVNLEWRKITKLVQAPGKAIKYRPLTLVDWINTIDQGASAGEIDVSRCGHVNTNRMPRNVHEIAYWNVENQTKLGGALAGKSGDFDLSKWNTSRFSSFFPLRFSDASRVDVSTLDLAECTSFSNCFERCNNLTYVDISFWDMDAATHMKNFALSCRSLRKIDLSRQNFMNVKDATSAFSDCSNLETLGTDTLFFPEALEIDHLFYRCLSLPTPPSVMAPKAKTASYAFAYCRGVDANQILYNMYSLEDVSYMFQSATLKNTTVNTNNTSSAILIATGMFQNSDIVNFYSLTTYTLSGLKKADFMFDGCRSLHTVAKNSAMETIELLNLTTTEGMFRNCSRLIGTPFSRTWKPFKLENVKSMFEGCTSLKTLDVGSWILAHCKYYDRMFYNCTNLSNIGNAYIWNTSEAVSWTDFYKNTKIPASQVPVQFR